MLRPGIAYILFEFYLFCSRTRDLISLTRVSHSALSTYSYLSSFVCSVGLIGIDLDRHRSIDKHSRVLLTTPAGLVAATAFPARGERVREVVAAAVGGAGAPGQPQCQAACAFTVMHVHYEKRRRKKGQRKSKTRNKKGCRVEFLFRFFCVFSSSFRVFVCDQC